MLLNYILAFFLAGFATMYGAFVGSAGGVAIMMLLMIYLKVFPSVTIMIGTLTLAASIPLSSVSLYEFYKNNKIDYWAGAAIIAGYAIGGLIGARSTFYLNSLIDEKDAEIIKFKITAVTFAILTLVYTYMIYR
jgi:uncharacterized membrane protein YfcA